MLGQVEGELVPAGVGELFDVAPAPPLPPGPPTPALPPLVPLGEVMTPLPRIDPLTMRGVLIKLTVQPLAIVKLP